MANNYLDSSLLDKAVTFAVKAHANTERRSKGFPYIVHPMEAVSIVATLTSDQELLAAAALHDVVEDTDITIEEIRKEFGDRVASLVSDESEERYEGIPEKDTWHKRKQNAIARLADASHDAKIVAIGDKLSNMRAIYRDFRSQGDKLWDRFHAPNGKPDHEWHYRGLAHSLSDLVGTYAYSEFIWLVNEVFDGEKASPIDLNDYEQTGEGYTALSYTHRNKKTMIKLYEDFIPQDVSLRELHTSWDLQEMGLNIPRAHRFVTDGKRYGVEFDCITPKKSFARAISDNPEKLEFYAEEFAKECKKLHSTYCTARNVRPIKEFFHSAVNNTTILNGDEKKKVHEFINNTPDALTCCHGDLHIGNIITNGERNYWIDLGDFSYGHHYFDIGMFYFICFANPEEFTQTQYHISNQQMRQVWKYFVKYYFGAETEEEQMKIKNTIKPYSALFLLFFSTRKELEPYLLEYVRECLDF